MRSPCLPPRLPPIASRKKRRQYSGNAHGLIRGIGVFICGYVNPEQDQFWLIDYRQYDPDGDGKSRLDYVRNAQQRHASQALTVSRRADGHLVRHKRPDAVHRGLANHFSVYSLIRRYYPMIPCMSAKNACTVIEFRSTSVKPRGYLPMMDNAALPW
jgi:hypothetical protein